MPKPRASSKRLGSLAAARGDEMHDAKEAAAMKKKGKKKMGKMAMMGKKKMMMDMVGG